MHRDGIIKNFSQQAINDHYGGIIENDWNYDHWHAACVALLWRDGLVFMRRSSLVHKHKKQLALFGGHREPKENDPWDTARREWHEETGIDLMSKMDLLGYLPPVFVGPKMGVICCVATLDSSHSLEGEFISNGEWDYVLSYPYTKLLGESSWGFFDFHYAKNYSVLYHLFKASDIYLLDRAEHFDGEIENQLLWGATAKMVWYLLGLVKF
jgi:8-oxo-dGTP pyrophosphatase MutT (NUDIX family)